MKARDMMKLLAVTILALLVGCTEWQQGSGDYRIYVDRSFDPHQQELLGEAIGEWSEKVRGTVSLRLVDDWKESENLITITPTTIVELTSTQEHDDFSDMIVGYTAYEGTSSVVEIATDLPDKYFAISSRHEIGHALGLSHTMAGELMDPSLKGCAEHVTPADLAQFCSIWGC